VLLEYEGLIELLEQSFDEVDSSTLPSVSGTQDSSESNTRATEREIDPWKSYDMAPQDVVQALFQEPRYSGTC